LERRLAAILAADVAGYTALMGADEAGTLQRFTGLRRDYLEPLIGEHKGRIVKLMGDGLLVEFASVVDAVVCALAWQSGMADRDDDLRFRIGINLGDVIVEGDDIHGDGVNIAARLESLAEPGGICLSGDAYRQAKGKVGVGFEDMGEQVLKNVADPLSVYRVVAEPSSGAASAATERTQPRPDKPAVAVLPFVNMSDDPEQLYFSDGLTEDIITELSRFKSLDVVAQNSTFVYRDQAADLSEIGAKVGASHLLEGSVRKAGKRIRLTAQLTDVKAGRHIWADRYDRELEDIFALQDELVRSIVSALAVRLTAEDTKRSLRKPAASLAAYDLYLRALKLDSSYNPESVRQAKELASQAIALDPGFARAYTMLAAEIFTCGWFEDAPADSYLNEALSAAAKAVELDPDDSFCTSTLATIHLLRREFDQARHYFDQALKSNPNDSGIWGDYAWLLTSTGQSEEALERLDSKENFEPYPPNWHWSIRGRVLYALRRYDEARASFERMSVIPFWIKGFLAACCGQLSDIEAAERYWAEALEVAPKMGETFVRRLDPYKYAVDVEHWLEGLRKAGLIE
jgi:TolB-like protein